VDGDQVAFVPGRDVTEVVEAVRSVRPAVLMVDSIHTMRDGGSDSLPGGPGQVRLCADALIGLAKDQGVTVVLAGHVTKDGGLAGPRTLEHAVDTVLSFDGDPRAGHRVLSAGKNRFGPEGEVAWFEMRSGGLEEVETGPRIGEDVPDPGCATALVLAGRRAFAVEVQALVVPTDGPPRRQVAGLDGRRFHILAAVTEQVMGIRLTRAELFGAAAGGLQLDDPGADLAVAAALASAAGGLSSRAGMAFLGEVSLTGSVRAVQGIGARLAAAAAAGVSVVVLPQGAEESARHGLRLVPVRHLREALASFGGASRRGPTGVIAGGRT
jgi:DNA repair protein RadA/Sms